jgi:hypothetical protein
MTAHLKSHGYDKEEARIASKEVRVSLNAANKKFHRVHGSWVNDFLNANDMNYANTCIMLKTLGHEVVDDVSTEQF